MTDNQSQLTELHQHITEAFGLEDMPEDLQKTFIEQFGDLLYESVMLRAVEELQKLDENILERFDTLLANEPEPEEVFGFLEENIENFEELVRQETNKLKERSDQLTEDFLDNMEPGEFTGDDSSNTANEVNE